jgi:heat shock protein HtpX
MSVQTTFSIPSELPADRMVQLLERIRSYHLLLHPELFRHVRRGKVGNSPAVAFTVPGPGDSWELEAVLWVEGGLQVRTTRPDRATDEAVRWLSEDLTNVVRTLESELRESTISLIWVKGEEIIPEAKPSMTKGILGRLLSRTLLLLNILLFAFNIVLFLLFGLYAVLLILLVQLLLIVFADKLFTVMGKWTITEASPEVYIMDLRIGRESLDLIRKKKVDLTGLKEAVYESSFGQGKEPNCSTISSTLLRFGILCSEDSIRVKTVNVLELVKKAAEPFQAPLPKIIISNNPAPNAAASGISFKRGVLLLTAGILSTLDEEELLSVIGHELGHLRGRDPLLLFALVSGEFILRLTVLFPLFLLSPLLYLVVSTFFIFFVAKFFEARADLLSVMKLGKPKVMASSLRKIGAQRLRVEEASKLSSWLRWDTHPPLYFRIERLEGMTEPVVVKHPLLESAKDVVRGFISAFRT